MKETITFDQLPEAVSRLLEKTDLLFDRMSRLEKPAAVPASSPAPVGLSDACKLLGKSKPTVYRLCHLRVLPHFKQGKKLYFFEKDLLEWIVAGKRKTMLEIDREVDDFLSRKK